MNLTSIKANMTVVKLGENYILFSYQTPVAIRTEQGFYKTAKFWSKTTSGHINEWFKGYVVEIETKPQEWFDNLVLEVK